MEASSITLRPFKLTDADDLMSWAGDDRVTQFIRWKTLTSKDEALTFIKDVCIPHPWRRSICVADRSIGFISVFPGSGDDRCRADIGFALSVEYWGRGITTAAVKMAVPQVFKDLPEVARLQAFADVKNIGSQRALEKAGFFKEGVLRKYSYLKGNLKDLVVYSVISTSSDPSVA
ncbi:OLC1v1000733C1 [Oldenlandia corymbosa var. corymbosa]|uniref:OLC1v1000733C1 n=1 Tax=Oldenlandia corymbosa var. corymbosa TaxID=529605 RepID=A0AAV1D548_OLDCO|nr:OLC1v1000733C1 [Oldenlandia corymbosa var. corymbosa]